MTWNLFIDDERNLEDVTWAPWQIREKYRNEEWVVCRTAGDAIWQIYERGCNPSFISFDHDLGDKEPTGFDLAKKLVDCALDLPDLKEFQFPENFDYYVHSQNPIGKANIEGLLNNYLAYRDKT